MLQLDSYLHRLRSFWDNALGLASSACLGIIVNGLVARLPDDTCVGDCLAIILGVSVPFELRPHGDDYLIVGLCYIHDMMDGQALASDYWKPRALKLV
jgi:hypothetical protein